MDRTKIAAALNQPFAIGQLVAENMNPVKPKQKINLDSLRKPERFTKDGLNFEFINYPTADKIASIITSYPWNLDEIDERPTTDAYFEVTFHNLSMNLQYASTFGIGVGNQIFDGSQLLGRQQNSISFLNDGSLYHNDETRGIRFPSFNVGDTIGAGVLLSSYNEQLIYFTKNGEFLGTYEAHIHLGMDFFPGVTFGLGSSIAFTINFEGPFQFDQKSVPNYRNDRIDRLTTLPAEILSTCLQYVAKKHYIASDLRLVSKTFEKIATDNLIWKDIYLAHYWRQNRSLKVRSWYKMFQRRFKIDPQQSAHDEPRIIENCDMEFECPLEWSLLKNIPNNSEAKHCSRCKKDVYKVSDQNVLEEYTEMGRCVSFYHPKRKMQIRGKFVTTNI